MRLLYKHYCVLQEMQICSGESWELVLISDINCQLSKWINMQIGLLFNHICIWAQRVFCSESQIRLGLYRGNSMRDSAVTVSEGTPCSLEPMQLLFINSCRRSVCSCIQQRRLHTPCVSHLIHAFTNTHTPQIPVQKQHQNLKLYILL